MSVRPQPSWQRTKIIATLGPASDQETLIQRLVLSGMDVARLNFSHGSHAEHAAKILRVRRAAQFSGRPVGLLQDLPGPKLRVGALPAGALALKRDEEVALTPHPRAGLPGPLIPVLYPPLLKDLRPGQPVFIADGAIRLTARRVLRNAVICVVAAGGTVRAGNGVNLPGSHLSLEAFTAQDRRHLAFGLQRHVDFVGISFVGTAGDMRQARAFCARRGASPFLIAKIERRQALDNLKTIVEASDGVMVARGDLGVEISFAEIPGWQEAIVVEAHRQGKPAIVATQMLESMLENPRPTRAEATDAANAVLEGADALMLSGETAVGQFPVSAVESLAAIIRSTERRHSQLHRMSELPARDISDTIVQQACHLAESLGARALVALTRSGLTAARASRARPPMPILAFLRDERLRRRFSVFAGVEVLPLVPPAGLAAVGPWLRKALLARGWARAKDKVVMVGGGPGTPQGKTGLIQVLTL